MAALIKCGPSRLLSSFNSYLKQNILLEALPLTGSKPRFIKTQPADSELINQASLENVTDYLIEEEEVDDQEWKRNKSRLLPQHRNMLHNTIPYSESKACFHNTVKYKRKMYGMHGDASGVNPAIMWPTKEEIVELKRYEGIAFSVSLQEMITNNQERKKAAAATLKAREDDITTKIVKLEQWKNEVRARSAKKNADAVIAKERKDRLVEEVRRHFGFRVDPREERFKEMLEAKEKAEKKTMKEQKKKDKEEKMIAKLQALKTE